MRFLQISLLAHYLWKDRAFFSFSSPSRLFLGNGSMVDSDFTWRSSQTDKYGQRLNVKLGNCPPGHPSVFHLQSQSYLFSSWRFSLGLKMLWNHIGRFTHTDTSTGWVSDASVFGAAPLTLGVACMMVPAWRQDATIRCNSRNLKEAVLLFSALSCAFQHNVVCFSAQCVVLVSTMWIQSSTYCCMPHSINCF